MPRVYIVQESKHDVYPAREYGEIRVMLMYDDVAQGNDRIATVLERELRNISSEDYILCIGDPVAIGLALHFALIKTMGTINVLTWDKRKVAYEESTIEL
jgi:hypothetical protein